MEVSTKLQGSVPGKVQISSPQSSDAPDYLPLRSLHERYRLVEKLGTGSFGSVILAKCAFTLDEIDNSHIDRKFNYTLIQNCKSNGNRGRKSIATATQNLVAIKTMMTKLNTLHDYTRVREIKFILSLPSNPHLIQVFELFIDNMNFQLHIVMESMDYNLYQLMKNRRRSYFSIPTLKSILSQILEGVRHIHEYGFFHRDLKPENILVSTSTSYFEKEWLEQGNYEHNYVVKLADFGLARNVTNNNPYTEYVSTRWYRSPEILFRNGYYAKPIDIWAFGCVAIEVAGFKPIFPGSDEVDQIWKILQILGTPSNMVAPTHHPIRECPGGSWPQMRRLAKALEMEIPYIEGASVTPFLSSIQLGDLIDVVKNCLLWDPDKRMTAEQLISMPFFKDTMTQLNQEEKSQHIDHMGSTMVNSTCKNQAMMFAGIKNDGQCFGNINIINETYVNPKPYVSVGPVEIYDEEQALNSNIIDNNEMCAEFEKDESSSQDYYDEDEDDTDDDDNAGSDGFMEDCDSSEPALEDVESEYNTFQQNLLKSNSKNDGTGDVTQLLLSYTIENEAQNNSAGQVNNPMRNANVLQEFPNDNGESLNDFNMETPLLQQTEPLLSDVIDSDICSTNRLLHRPYAKYTQHSGNRHKGINSHYSLVNEREKLAAELETSQTYSDSNNYSLEEITPRTFFTTGCGPGQSGYTKLASKDGPASGNYLGNITF